MDTYSIYSQIHKTSDCGEDNTPDMIAVLVNQLHATNGITRMQAREKLICIGKPAVPALVRALSSDDPQLRWQVVKVLDDIRDISAIPNLVESLKDESESVRWTASTALLKYKRATLPYIFQALMRDSDSVWLRRGIHHILHVMKDSGELTATELTVFDALENVEPSASVPWAAQKALETLRIKN
jgi:HEAT repeat protein